MQTARPLMVSSIAGLFIILVTLAGSLQAADNPLGVEWVGGKEAANSTGAPLTNTLGVNWVGGSSGAKPPAPSGSNPLDVEWAGESQGRQPAPVSGNNPLGVEWQAGSSTTAPAPSEPQMPKPVQPAPQQPVAPQPQPQPQPEPVQPSPEPSTPQPVSPPSPVTPPSGTDAAMLASDLVDTWKYLAVAFSDSKGTISETRGVRGTLKFKADGQYEQALYIGEILNALKGEYRVSGNRLETRYLWRGQLAIDPFEIYLDPSGKRLTMTSTGTPRAYYTLERME